MLEATDVVLLISETTSLKRVGTCWFGSCPFHAAGGGLLTVNSTTGLWQCSGCEAGGDAISFVQKLSCVGFAESLEILAYRAGLVIPGDEDDARRRHRERAQSRSRRCRTVWRAT